MHHARSEFDLLLHVGPPEASDVPPHGGEERSARA
jgi:hypothetical protein